MGIETLPAPGIGAHVREPTLGPPAEQKRQEALEGLVKKKDEAEQKQFKKGHEDLEKELGF